MRVHGSQKTVTQLHGTSKGALTSTGYPTGLDLAEEHDDMAGIWEREGIGLLRIRRRAMEVLEALPRLSVLDPVARSQREIDSRLVPKR